jgi:hypothetical protein
MAPYDTFLADLPIAQTEFVPKKIKVLFRPIFGLIQAGRFNVNA